MYNFIVNKERLYNKLIEIIKIILEKFILLGIIVPVIMHYTIYTTILLHYYYNNKIEKYKKMSLKYRSFE